MDKSKEVQLIIKAPNQNISDQIVPCNVDWTILELKAHLSDVYPNKPGIRDQKIIYSGRLLRDHLYLKDVLGHNEYSTTTVYTLHLVCARQHKLFSFVHPMELRGASQNMSPGTTTFGRRRYFNNLDDSNFDSGQESSQSSSSEGSSNIADYIPSSSTPEAVSDVESTTPTPATPTQVPYIQQMYANYMTQQNQNFGTSLPVWPSTQMAQPYDIVTQVALYQQMCANYYDQCLRNYQMSTGYNPMPVMPGVQPNAVPVANNQNNLVGPPQPVPNRNAGGNGQGGQQPDDNENPGNRDWLDYFYLWCRGFVLFSIVYFYSSPERLLLVVGLALMGFLYQEGWLLARMRNNRFPENRPQQQPQQAAPNENQNPTDDAPQPNQDANPDNSERPPENEIEAIMDADNPPHAENNPDLTNNQNPAWTFISSFFSSLIPERPPPVNIN